MSPRGSSDDIVGGVMRDLRDAPPLARLRRLQLIDKRGVCVFDKPWRWDVETRPERVAAFVHCLRQFSREIDEGGSTPW